MDIATMASYSTRMTWPPQAMERASTAARTTELLQASGRYATLRIELQLPLLFGYDVCTTPSDGRQHCNNPRTSSIEPWILHNH